MTPATCTAGRALAATLRPEDVTAIVDTREQMPLSLEPLRVEFATLPTGDYSLKGLENIVAVERKGLGDLLSCVGVERKRFDREVKRLLAYPVRCLVIESTGSVKYQSQGLSRGPRTSRGVR